VGAAPLPDPTCTPGAINPLVSQGDIGTTICKAGYTETIRPPDSITQKEKVASAAAYRYTGSLLTAEYDHLIPLELGGDPNDPSNLWVEPNDNPNANSTSNTKDTLENKLNDLVCSGEITLAQAQRAIATDWVAALQTYGGLLAGTTTTSTPSTTSAPVTSPSSSSSSGVAVAGSSGATGASSTVGTGTSPALATTGPGPGLKTMTLVGATIMILGLLMLVLADIPRRVLRQLVDVSSRASRGRMAGEERTRNDVAGLEVATSRDMIVTYGDGPIANGADGWYPDPFAVHQERVFKLGRATPIVRDNGVTSYDPPQYPQR